MGGGLNSDRIARTGLAKKLSVEQRPKEGKEAGHADICGESTLEGKARAVA